MKELRNSNSAQQTKIARVMRMHFIYILTIAAAIMAFDAWKLIPPDVLRERWILVIAMFIVSTILWYLNTKNRSRLYYQTLIYGLVAINTVVASFSVYLERGMASRSVALFAVPIALTAVLNSRRALYATASLCAGLYSFAAIRYFTNHPSEGYKVELYGNVGFYAASFFILAALLAITLDPGKN